MLKSKEKNPITTKERLFVNAFLAEGEIVHWIGKTQNLNYFNNFFIQIYWLLLFSLLFLIAFFIGLSLELSGAEYQGIQIFSFSLFLSLLTLGLVSFFYYRKMLRSQLYVVTNKRSILMTNFKKNVLFINHERNMLVTSVNEDDGYGDITVGRNTKLLVETVDLFGALDSIVGFSKKIYGKKIKVKNYKHYKLTFRSVMTPEKIKKLIDNQCSIQ